jgi:hypothetical protein
MTQGITGRRNDDWVHTDPTGAPPPAARPSHDVYEPLVPPLLPQPLPRTALAPPLAPPTTQAARDAQVRINLDAFRQAMNAPYQTPEGVAWPGTTFQMTTRYPLQGDVVTRNTAALNRAIATAKLNPSEALDLVTGRGSPEAIHAVTQALIHQGQLPDASEGTLDARVRILMFNHGIGVDCAGYVQRAYLRVMHLDRASAHFGRTDESLSTLGARGYTRIVDLAGVRPGDIVSLGPPRDPLGGAGEPGHRAIVYEQHLASTDELAELRATGETGTKMAAAGPVRVVQVDSSWGSSGDPQLGGVRRETWWRSETTGAWAWLQHASDGSASLLTASTPMAHPFASPFGIFRGSDRR